MEKENQYHSYAVMKGAGLISLDFGDDIAMDKNAPTITVPQKRSKKDLEFVVRGGKLDVPSRLLDIIGDNVTLSSNTEYKTNLVCGDSIVVYRRHKDDSGKIVNVEVTAAEEPAIFDFLENNEYETLCMELANDLVIYNDAYVEYGFNRQDPPRLVSIKHRETSCSLISTIDKLEQCSLYHGYSSNWADSEEEPIITPLLNRRYPTRDLCERMGLIPNAEGKTEVVKERHFVHNIELPTPGRFYYARPYWWSVITSGWAGFASAIPKYKKALLNNEMAIRTIVYIRDTFWGNLFKDEGAISPKEQAKVKENFLKTLEDFVSGNENAGKTLCVNYRINLNKAVEEKDIIIEKVDLQLKGGEYIEDSEEASNTLCYGMGVHPSIIGSSPGKTKNINGTEARELFCISQALVKKYQKAVLKPLYMAKRVNGWDSDIEFGINNSQLVTLDQNSGAKKNKGFKPVTEEE